MYPDALALLRCPAHPHVRLELAPGAVFDAEGAVERGSLGCRECARSYPIEDGIADLLQAPLLLDSPAQLTNALPATAWAYERLWRSRALTLLSGERFGYDRELPLIVGLAQPERGGLLIDVACSNGLYARALAAAPGAATRTVVGIDHSLPMLREARASARRASVRVSYICAKAQALPFADRSAQAVLMGGSLNEIGDAGRALREWQRVAAPAARCVMMSLVQAHTPAGRALQQSLGLGGVVFPTLDQLNQQFAAAGLRLRAQWRYRVVVFSLLIPHAEP